jgi:acyl-CoA synthetase (AMP-forming)/AMP-acid ligase II
VGQVDARWGEVAVALVVMRRAGDGRDFGTALAAWCRERLAPFKVPVAFHRVEDLPRTPGGKVRRRAARALVPVEREDAGGARR